MKAKGRLTAIIVGICVVGAVYYFLRGRAAVPSPVAHAPTPGVETHLLGSANIIEPYDEQEVPDLVLQFRVSCLASCRDLIGEARLDSASMESFCDAASERLRLYLAPSYDAYREYVKRLTGRDPEGSGATNIFSKRGDFEGMTSGMRLLPFDPASVHVRAVFIGGRSVAPLTADASYTPDSGLFFSAVGQEPKKARATIYEVLVPVEARDPFHPDTRFSLVLGMAFVRELDGRWKPWQMSFHDPSGVKRITGSPWL